MFYLCNIFLLYGIFKYQKQTFSKESLSKMFEKMSAGIRKTMIYDGTTLGRLGASPSSSSLAERRLAGTAGEGACEFSCILGECRPPGMSLLDCSGGVERWSANRKSLAGGARRPWFEIIVVVA
jgi:hypothetical protein